MKTILVVAVACLLRPLPCLALQGPPPPWAANPERPTVATHAYTVAPGYAELEQGVRAFGLRKFTEFTAWDVNLKIGLEPGLQLGLFGLPYARSGAGGGMGDVGVALKFSRAVSSKAAVAIVPAVTVPTGDNSRGLGAGRTLGSLVGVFSADLSGGGTVHFDANAGPMGIGAGTPLWFTSIGLSFGGTVAVATELFDLSGGGAAPRQRGFLAALMVTASPSVVLDLGGVRGLVEGTPHQVFVGLTTNLGAIFK